MPRQNTSPANYPQAVLQKIEQLGQNIVIARKRRGETQAQWAKKLGVSQPTMARIERGDPAVAMASYVMCMWLINQAEGLEDLIAPLKDHAALEREVLKARKKRKAPAPTGIQKSSDTREPGYSEAGALTTHEQYPASASNAVRIAAEPLADARALLGGSSTKSNATAEGLASLVSKTKI